MNEDFVPFELAVKLKEKGFREECLCHYIGEDLIYNIKSPIANNQLWFCHNKYDNIWHRDNVDAPTISQVLKWLRKEKKIHVEPCMLANVNTDAEGKVINEYVYWSFNVKNIESGGIIYVEYDKRFNSYEQAVLTSIKCVLDNLI